jgi:hypothetical protein
MLRPLWKLLTLVHDFEKDVNLSCEECFMLLEFDADLFVSGADIEALQPSVRKHLTLCANCRAELADWVDKLEKAHP